jgi:hypothetical protein
MDYTGILTQAAKLLWKHKVIYVFFLVMYAIPSLLSLGLMGIFAFTIDMSNPERFFHMFGGAINFTNPFVLGLASAYFVLMLLTYSCLIIGLIGVLKGTSLVESGTDQINFMSLWQASMKYFWRVAAIFFVIGGAFIIIMLPAIILGPLVILMFLCLIPIFLFGRTFVELVCAAIITDDLGLQAAFERIWQLIKSYIWPLVLMTILLVAVEFAANMVVTMPISVVQQIAMQFLFLRPPAEDPSLMFGQMFKWMFVIMAFVMPVMLAVQGLVTTYHLSATSLLYLNITRKTMQPVPPVEVVPAVS